MAIYFLTDDPDALLEAFREKIDMSPKSGSITTWEEAEQGFTHTADQLYGQGYLQPRISTYAKQPALSFGVSISPGLSAQEKTYVRAELQGNLLATFVKHFESSFTRAVYVDQRKKK